MAKKSTIESPSPSTAAAVRRGDEIKLVLATGRFTVAYVTRVHPGGVVDLEYNLNGPQRLTSVEYDPAASLADTWHLPGEIEEPENPKPPPMKPEPRRAVAPPVIPSRPVVPPPPPVVSPPMRLGPGV